MTVFKSHYPDVEISDLSITERVLAGLVNRPNDTVIIDGPSNQGMTADAVMTQIKKLAGGLAARGYGKDHVVAIMAPNMPLYCVVFHAVAWGGGTITTLNPTYTANEVQHQLQDSQAELLITTPDFLDTARQAAVDTRVNEIAVIGEAEGFVSLDELMGEPIEEQVAVDLDRHSVVLPYSSGTTGLPKGVKLSHRGLVVNVDQVLAGVDFREGEIAASFLPFFHIYGMNVMMNTHLAGGGSLVTMPRFDLPLLLQICQDYKCRRIWSVPPVVLALAKHPLVDEYDLSSVEQIFSGAAPMGAELSNAASERLGCVSVQGFGMTELSPVSHATPGSAPRAGSSGLALPNTLCRIVDIDTGENLSAGEEGELWIKGPQVMQGYLNNAAATASTITDDGWLRTGDIAIIDDDGYMFIVDRLKELIKYKGFQVAPAELEAALVTHPQINDAAVIGMADDEAGEIPVAIIQADEDNAPTLADIQAHLSGIVASYKQIQQVYFIADIPKSASGKILRRLIRDQLNAGELS